MKLLYLNFIRIYLNILGTIIPKLAGKTAFNIFQKVRLKTPKKREKPFYELSKHFTIAVKDDTLDCYEIGNPKGNLLFMVHGWDSNAGSLLLFAKAFAAAGYRVITFDLLAHHKSTKKYTNLYETKAAFALLLASINPQEPFSIIGHSFGASALAYTLAETNYKVDKIVLLSSNDYIIDVFRDFQKFIGFNERVFQYCKYYIDDLIQDDFAKMSTSSNLKNIDFNQLLIIHDKKDKVIPFKNATQIHAAIPNSKLIAFERIGHYRMLWNKEVVAKTLQFVENNEK